VGWWTIWGDGMDPVDVLTVSVLMAWLLACGIGASSLAGSASPA
jgi:hypothetical protein